MCCPTSTGRSRPELDARSVRNCWKQTTFEAGISTSSPDVPESVLMLTVVPRVERSTGGREPARRRGIPAWRPLAAFLRACGPAPQMIQEHGGALRSDVYVRLSVGRTLANEMPLLPLRSVAARFGMKCYPRIAHLGSRVTLRASVRRHRRAPQAGRASDRQGASPSWLASASQGRK